MHQAPSRGTTLPPDDLNYRARVMGLIYRHFLRNLHEQCQPRTYLEIGVRSGETLALASCASIGIDPAFALADNVMANKPLCLLFQETSDRFFEHRDPRALLGGPIELAFLDGMHLCEFLLRDFINVERHCGRDSIIALHDCLPPYFGVTTRDATATGANPAPYQGWWAGDVWKLVPVLRQYRPDLSIELVDCRPTGLVMITNLDPQNRVLDRAYAEITANWAAKTSDSADFHRYWAGAQLTPSISLMTAQQLAARYRFRRSATAEGTSL